MQCVIFTDGASKGNPGRGGWGAVVVAEGSVTELGGREAEATNNQMELMAAIEALACARKLGMAEATVYADSSYVLNGITKWVHGWRKNGWKTQSGQPVLNTELWKRLLGLAESPLKIRWEYVGGHINVPGNERADVIASDFAEDKPVQLYQGPLDGYGIRVLDISHDESQKRAKSASRQHAKAKAYSYVSEVDGVVKIHKTWVECEARVRGKKARFKKAVSAADEREIVAQYSPSGQ